MYDVLYEENPTFRLHFGFSIESESSYGDPLLGHIVLRRVDLDVLAQLGENLTWSLGVSPCVVSKSEGKEILTMRYS